MVERLVMDYKSRRNWEAEAKSQGWTWDYLEGTGQPKVDNWWHRDTFNVEGQLASPRGTLVPNQPNEPDSNMRRARRGLLPYPPGETCLCKGCREANGLEKVQEVIAVEPESQSDTKCADCGWEAYKGTPKQKAHRLTWHRRRHEKVAV